MSVSLVGGGTAYVYGPASRIAGTETTPAGTASPSSGGDRYIPSGGASPSSFTPYGPSAGTSAPASVPDSGSAPSGDISPAVGGTSSSGGSGAIGGHECKTCAERTYQDVSDDPGVSFQSATHVSPDAAAMAVSSHESEHVGREQLKAAAEGSQVVSQNVQIHTSVCPECGRVYVSGGTTTTVTRSAPESSGSQGVNVTA